MYPWSQWKQSAGKTLIATLIKNADVEKATNDYIYNNTNNL